MVYKKTDLIHQLTLSWHFHLLLKRVLEADALEDGYHDADDFDVDIPKRKHRGKGRVSNLSTLVMFKRLLLLA